MIKIKFTDILDFIHKNDKIILSENIHLWDYKFKKQTKKYIGCMIDEDNNNNNFWDFGRSWIEYNTLLKLLHETYKDKKLQNYVMNILQKN